MNWTTKTSSFRYAGTPVTRTTHIANTPLGQFKAYEAVNGTPRYKHPFIDWGAGGMPGFQPDPEGDITPRIGILARSLEDAKVQCEMIWDKIKARINEY